jgi:hypothetical protein
MPHLCVLHLLPSQDRPYRHDTEACTGKLVHFLTASTICARRRRRLPAVPRGAAIPGGLHSPFWHAADAPAGRYATDATAAGRITDGGPPARGHLLPAAATAGTPAAAAAPKQATAAAAAAAEAGCAAAAATSAATSAQPKQAAAPGAAIGGHARWLLVSVEHYNLLSSLSFHSKSARNPCRAVISKLSNTFRITSN